MLDDKTKALLAKRVAKMPLKRVTSEVRDSIATEFARGTATPKELAKKHKVSLTTVYKWIAKAAQ